MLRTICFAVVVLVAGNAAAVRADDAPTFRGDAAHTGVYAGSGPRALAEPAWTFRTKARLISSPAVVRGVAYVGSTDGFLYAVGAADGRERWKFQTGARIASSPAVSDGVVYVMSYDGKLYAVDAARGVKRWEFATAGERRFTAPHLHGVLPLHEPAPDPWDFYESSPVVSGGVVYAGSGDGNVYAVDARSGALRWKYQTGDVVHASPAVAGGTVYVGSWDTYFYALDAASGALKWRFKTGEDLDIHNQTGIQASAAVAGGTVYFGCRDHHVYALDAASGALRWSFATGGTGWASSSPAVSRGVVYFGEGSSGIFRAVDAASGAEVFSVPFKTGFFSSTAIAGTGALAYIGGYDGMVHVLDLGTRSEIASFATDGAKALAARNAANPIAPAEAGRFYDAMVSNVSLATSSAVLASPVLVDGTLYIAGGDGTLYAFR